MQTERERLKPLCAVFGSTKVNRITVEMVRTYMADRKAAGVANKTINLELGVLRGVVKRAKLWHLFMDEIKPLPVHTQIGRAMTLDEKLRLAKTAANEAGMAERTIGDGACLQHHYAGMRDQVTSLV